ncbi:hypothetical protein BsWGS_28378 [Bradybaena similaris]
MSLFKGLQIGLDLGCGVNFKKKAELRKKIVENGGIISYIVTKNCHIVVTSNPEKCDVSSKCRMAIKYGLPVLRLDYIWDSLDADKLLSHDSYIVGGKSRILDFKSGKIAAGAHIEKPKKYTSKPAFNPRTIKIWSARDVNQPRFNEDNYEIAKYAVFMGYNSSLKSQYTTILELHTPPHLSGLGDKSAVAMDDSSTDNLFAYRVVCQSGGHKDLEAGKPGHKEIRYVSTADQALAVFAMLHEDVEKKGELTKCRHPVRGVGSPKLQKLMAEVVDVGNDSSEEVKELVDHVWREAMAEVTAVLGDIRKIKLEQVEKAEAILVKVRDALKTSLPEKTIQSLIEDFYSALPHSHERPDVEDKKRWLTRKQDMCQLIKDMLAVGEMTNYETRAYVEAKYAALRCRITNLSGSQKHDIVNLIQSSLESPTKNLQVLNVFDVWRWTEDLDFRHDLDRKELLFHSSKVENFVGILSRGLLLPKIVVDDFGGKRSDAGMLGSGIYFASAASTSMKYSSPSNTKGSRLLLVNEVALGSCKDYIKHDLTLVAPPEGYNSTHGVSRKWDKSSEFENDEFVVYEVNQQRIRYLVEFTMQDDIVKPLEKIATVDTSIICDAVENTSLQDVTGIADPMSKVKPGLIGTGGKEVELRCVHVRAKLVDLAAQVVVLQEYFNNSQQAIEAKYVFPLDDAAAVCGFEAFINGKHIIGEVKEKEVAHKEYKQAISEGHGAYLMDQDEETPDMFTVSVGNLPPQACVLIKITYVAELQIEDEKISFLLPAAVAPWKEESALKLSTQEILESYKMSATKTTVQVAVEMPFEIRSLHCPTHQIRVKQTASKAYVEMVDNQKFGAGFQLLIGLAEIHVPRMWVERHADNKEHQACMLTFYPEFESSEVAEGEITLILDVSNSVKGTSLLEAKKVALLVLQNLPTGWSFNVATFGSDYEELFPAPRTSTQENLQLANQFVQNCTSNKGNTDIMRPLRPLFLLPHTDKQRNVFLISDGHINDAELVLHCAKQNSRHTRLFSFGVSATCNTYTLKAVSRVSGGAFEYFNSKTKSKWEPKVKSQISKARQPGLTSVNVEWHQYNDNHPVPVQAPQQITALFNGSHQVVYGFVPDCTMATLTAEVDGQKVSTVVSTSELSITEGLLVHRLTAKAVIRDWNDGILSRDRTKHEVAKMDLKNYIIDLSKEYSVVTQFTSFIAVEKRDENEKDLPKEGPHIEELVAQENVDFLSYMGWTHVPEDDNLAILSVFEELSQEVKEESLSNKMVCQLNSVAEKYKKLRRQMGPCDEDVLRSARTLTEAFSLSGDADKAANLAETAYKEAVSSIHPHVEQANYDQLASILVDLKEKVVASKGREQTQITPIPFPVSQTGIENLLVRTPAGSRLRISCNGSITARQLKHLIQVQDNTPVHKQKLIFHGKPLEDFVSLVDQNVGYGDQIELEIPAPKPVVYHAFSHQPATLSAYSGKFEGEKAKRRQRGHFLEQEISSGTSAQLETSSSIPQTKALLEVSKALLEISSAQKSELPSDALEETMSGQSWIPEIVPASSTGLAPSVSTSASSSGFVVPEFPDSLPPLRSMSRMISRPADISAPSPAPTQYVTSGRGGFGSSRQAMKTGGFNFVSGDIQLSQNSPAFSAKKRSSSSLLTPGTVPFEAKAATSFGLSALSEEELNAYLPALGPSDMSFFGASVGAPTSALFGASKKKGFGAPAPSGFGAPAPSGFRASQPPGVSASLSSPFYIAEHPAAIGAKPPSFGAPPPPSFGATPSPSFVSLPPPPPPSFGAPASSSFIAPQSLIAPPPASLRAPQPPSFGAPSSSSFGAPPLSFGAPPLSFGAPPPSCEALPPFPSRRRAQKLFGVPESSLTFGTTPATTSSGTLIEASKSVGALDASASVEETESSGFGLEPPSDFVPEKSSGMMNAQLQQSWRSSTIFRVPRSSAPVKASAAVAELTPLADVGGLAGAPAHSEITEKLITPEPAERFSCFQHHRSPSSLAALESAEPPTTIGSSSFKATLDKAQPPASFLSSSSRTRLDVRRPQPSGVTSSSATREAHASPLAVTELQASSTFTQETLQPSLDYKTPVTQDDSGFLGCQFYCSDYVAADIDEHFLSSTFASGMMSVPGLPAPSGKRYEAANILSKFGQSEQTTRATKRGQSHKKKLLEKVKEVERHVEEEAKQKVAEEIGRRGGKESAQENMACDNAAFNIDEEVNDDDFDDYMVDIEEINDDEFDDYIVDKLDTSIPNYLEKAIKHKKEKRVKYKKYAHLQCSDRRQLQFSNTDKGDLSAMAAGITCIRAKEVHLTIEDFDKLLDWQSQQGSWKLGEPLDQLLGVNSQQCRSILVANGLRSLGSTATEHIEDLIATILVLFSISEFLKPGFLPSEVSASALSKVVDQLTAGFDEETWSKFSLPYEKVQKMKEAVRKAYMFCCKTERQYPCVYSILELGTNWVNVATAFLQPSAA